MTIGLRIVCYRRYRRSKSHIITRHRVFTIMHMFGASFVVAKVRFGSNQAAPSPPCEGLESAHLARCGSPQRRSPDRTDSRRSGLSVGTGQSARQGCDRSKPRTNRYTERPAQCRPRAEPKQEAGRLTGRPSASSDYPIECARRCSAPGVTSLRRRDLARRGAIQISR